jgi:hypothetical protein
MITMNDLNEGEKREQIPSESGPEGRTGKIISEQNAIEGQRKEVNVESYSDVAEIGQILKDFDFPARKDKILEFIRDKITPVNKERIYSALSKIEDKEYKNVSDVTTASGLVY